MSVLQQRSGIGYDSHRFDASRPLVLGGVVIPGVPGLAGHSDADVVAHAVIDALLGAVGMGDIGQRYPDHDPRWRDADSIELLRDTAHAASGPGWQVVHVDVSIVAEHPRLEPHKPGMAKRLAAALGIGVDAVNVKATTNEGMGFVGRGEGIAGLAVVQVEREIAGESVPREP